jgi:hypothetical protein
MPMFSSANGFSQTTLKDHLGTHCKPAYLSKVVAELKTFKKK